jgi:hypothetical protein
MIERVAWFVPLVFAVGVSAVSAQPTVNDRWLVRGDVERGYLGSSVASAGDVNGDGYDDLLVGAPGRDAGALIGAGRVQLFLGGPLGLSTQPAWSFDGGNAGAHVGSSVASAGDVNGDGYDDVLVGAPGEVAPVDIAGRALLFLGSAKGLPAAPDRTFTDARQPGSLFGASVASAGDVDADGYDDILVGAPTRDRFDNSEGAAFLYRGSAAGPSTAASWTAADETKLALFGGAVAGAGDVNGDGYDDVVIGAFNWGIWVGATGTTFGRIYVFHGSPTGLAAAPALVVTGRTGSDFGLSVAGAGDVNGDGFDDVIVGAPEWAQPLGDQGAALVFMGSPAGLASTPAWSVLGPLEVVLLGHSVAGAGDVNGDGFDDVAVGVPWYPGFEPEPAFRGRALVYAGSPSGLALEPLWSQDGRRGNFGRAVAGAGDVDGDGFADVAIGIPFIDAGAVIQAGAVRLRPGAPTVMR